MRLWNLHYGGVEENVLRGHTGDVRALASLAAGAGGEAQRLASAGADCAVRLWDVDYGTCLFVMEGHRGAVSCLVDLGGGRLLSGSGDAALRVWNTATGACLAVVEHAHSQPICAACAVEGGAATGAGLHDLKRWTWDPVAEVLTRARPRAGALFMWRSDEGKVRSMVSTSSRVVVGHAEAEGCSCVDDFEVGGHGVCDWGMDQESYNEHSVRGGSVIALVVVRGFVVCRTPHVDALS